MAFLLASALAHAQTYGHQKVVYDLGNGTAGHWRHALISIRNHLRIVGPDRIRISMVIHGRGVRMLDAARSEASLRHQLTALRRQGVRFRVSRAALASRHMRPETLPGIRTDDLVESGAAEIVHLEQRGYIYINP